MVVGAQVAHSKKYGATQLPEMVQQCLSDEVVGAWHSYFVEGHSPTEAQTTALVTVAAVETYSVELQVPRAAQARGVNPDAAEEVHSVAEQT